MGLLNGQPEGATNCSEILCKTQEIATETFATFNAVYGDDAMKRTACFKWHECFNG